jgi:hypothetical protein
MDKRIAGLAWERIGRRSVARGMAGLGLATAGALTATAAFAQGEIATPAGRTATATTSWARIAAADAVLVLVDYNRNLMDMTNTMDMAALRNNAVALMKLGTVFGLPTIVLGEENEYYGEFMPEIRQIHPQAPNILRPAPSGWSAPEFRDAVAATGRRTLLLGGISTDNCVSLTSFDAIRDGYRAVVVVDASATGNPLVEQVSLQRLAQAGATLTAWVQLGAEMLESWATPEGEQLAQVFQEHLSLSTLSPS